MAQKGRPIPPADEVWTWALAHNRTYGEFPTARQISRGWGRTSPSFGHTYVRLFAQQGLITKKELNGRYAVDAPGVCPTCGQEVAS